jgi:hypothetical protein
MKTFRDVLAIFLMLCITWMLWFMAFGDSENQEPTTTTVVETCTENGCLIPPLVIEREN